jgi:hypothetical protein
MGRTVPSFRIALAIEEKEWKPFRNALDKKASQLPVYLCEPRTQRAVSHT